MNQLQAEADRAFTSATYEQAAEALKSLGDHGNAYALLYLAELYAHGKGVTQDYSKALACYIAADTQGGLAEAQYRLGVICEQGELGVSQSFEVAEKWYRHAAEQGFAPAQFKLGAYFESGTGVPQDFEEAVKWYRSAALQGFPQAQCNLGGMYDFGKGVPQDFQVAISWYQLAAEQGFANAQFNLGVMYNLGKGVSTNNILAHMWFNLVAISGDEQAVKYREIVAQSMTPQQIAEAQKMARKWRNRLSSRDDKDQPDPCT